MLQIAKSHRDLALFDLAIDSKLRSCDLVKLKIRDIAHDASILKRAIVMQQKTSQPVQFEITQQTREAMATWINLKELTNDDYSSPSRTRANEHITTRQYARIVKSWVTQIGLSPND
jgi:site-specific recombinase XerC